MRACPPWRRMPPLAPIGAVCGSMGPNGRRHAGERRWPDGKRGEDERAENVHGKDRPRRPVQAGAGERTARSGARSEPGRGTQEPQRNGLLLPPSALRRRRPGETRIQHAGGLDQVEVPGLRPRRPTARRAAERRSGDRQGPDGPAQSAAVPARGRRAGVHRQGQQPVGDAAERQGAAELQQRPHRQSRSMPTSAMRRRTRASIWRPRSRTASPGG